MRPKPVSRFWRLFVGDTLPPAVQCHPPSLPFHRPTTSRRRNSFFPLAVDIAEKTVAEYATCNKYIRLQAVTRLFERCLGIASLTARFNARTYDAHHVFCVRACVHACLRNASAVRAKEKTKKRAAAVARSSRDDPAFLDPAETRLAERRDLRGGGGEWRREAKPPGKMAGGWPPREEVRRLGYPVPMDQNREFRGISDRELVSHPLPLSLSLS